MLGLQNNCKERLSEDPRLISRDNIFQIIPTHVTTIGLYRQADDLSWTWAERRIARGKDGLLILHTGVYQAM